MTYKTDDEQLSKEPALKIKAKVHKKRAKPFERGGARKRAGGGSRRGVVWIDSPGWTRLKRAAECHSYHVAKLDLCDHKDLGRPANRPRTFAVFSLERPVRDLNDAFTATCRSHAERAEWKWLEHVIMKKKDLVRYIAYVRYESPV